MPERTTAEERATMLANASAINKDTAPYAKLSTFESLCRRLIADLDARDREESEETDGINVLVRYGLELHRVCAVSDDRLRVWRCIDARHCFVPPAMEDENDSHFDTPLKAILAAAKWMEHGK